MTGFRSVFGPDPERNQRLWERVPGNPVVPTGTGDWVQDFLSPSSVAQCGGDVRLYVEGSAHGVEQIGVFTCPADAVGTGAWRPHPENPIVRVGDAGFDKGSVFDPAVVRFQDRWLLYYSATESDAHAFAESLSPDTESGAQPADETIGLASSPDGVRFVKHGEPVLSARCPFAVVHEGVVHLFFVRVVDGGYRIGLATSRDGVAFDEVPHPVLDVGPPGAWDSYSVTTPKVFRDGDAFCMLYAGDDRSLDDPRGIGLAVSRDLVHWEKHDGNPVFATGPAGAFDAVSVASGVIASIDGRYWLWYGGSDRAISEGLHSQVGLARLRTEPA